MSWKLQERAWRLLPGGLTSLAIAVCLKLGVFQPIEQISYQFLFQTRGAIPWDDRLVLVAIDDASIRQIGRFPWSRQQYVKLLNLLTDADASVVVVDLLWSEPSSRDAQLAEAMANHGRVVLAQAWDATGQPLMPVSLLGEGAIATGHVMKREDNDGLVRQIEMQIKGQPALSLATAKSFSLVQSPVTLPSTTQPMWLNWVGPAQTLPQHSFVDVVQGKVPRQAFQNKIVLVGVTATGLDPLFTPFNRDAPASSVYLHATGLQNLLQQNALQPTHRSWLWLVLLVGGPGLSWFLVRLSTRRQLAVVVAACGVWSIICLGLFQSHYLPPITAPLALFILTAGATTLSERLREDRLLRQQVAQLWQHYHHDLVETQPLSAAYPKQLAKLDGTLRCVTQLADLADQLGRSQSAQAAIARSLSVGVLAADENGTIWFCNPVATQWLEVKVGDRLPDHLVPAWLTQEQWQTSLDQLKSFHAANFTNLYQETQWFDLQLQPITASSNPGQPLQTHALNGFVMLLENVTTRQQTEAELHLAKEAALQEAARSAQANRAKTEFLANMSHELRTPLNVILGFTQVMSRDLALNREQQKQLEIISRSGQQLLGLINDVLEMAKIEAGHTKLNKTTFNLYSLLDDLVEMLQVKAIAKQISLTLDYAYPVPQYVITDESKLRQVLLNLISNAVKFTQVGCVMVRVRTTPANPCHLFFEVEDTGPGIALDEIEHVFEAFVQTKTGRQAKEGTGLGLSISRKFVNLMGGTITAESIVGEGSTFKFDIQVVPVEQAKVPRPSVIQRVLGIVPTQPAYRILVVEDRQENSEFLVRLLERLGFELKNVTNGRESIAAWQDWRPDLILMDMWMPEMDGYTATRRIRALEQGNSIHFDREARQELLIKNGASLEKPPALSSSTKIIAVTANVFEDTQVAIANAGCNDIIHKPVQEDVLLAKLEQHLGVKYVYQAALATEAGSNYQDVTLSAEAIAALQLSLRQMPEPWLLALHQAATKGFDYKILHLVNQLPNTHAPLAEALNAWANQYYFDKIIELTSPLIQP